MSTVNGINPATNATSGTQPTTTKSNNTLGQDDFLKLLVAQMQNQDPTQPTDNTQSIAEMAQFSSLQEMTNISTSMDALSQTMTNFSQQSSLLQGAALIGKSVSGVDTDGVTPIEGTVQAVTWLDGDPKLQILKADGTTTNLEMSLITQVQETPPAAEATAPVTTP